jgi:WD40 repeat protein
MPACLPLLIVALFFHTCCHVCAHLSPDKKLKMWDLTGTLRATLEGHYREVVSVDFAADGKKIVSGKH